MFNQSCICELNVFTVADVTENLYYVTETKCVGFKIVCKDKRKDTRKTNQKNQINY